MGWNPIATADQAGVPFTVWIYPWGDPAEDKATVEEGCTLDATGAVVDATGDLVENATHWRVQ